MSLLDLLREAAERLNAPVSLTEYKRDVPQRHRRVEISVPAWGYVTSASVEGGELQLTNDRLWAIVGALMENEERLALSYRADYAEWSAVVIDDPLVHGDSSPVDAMCRAWLAAHPAEVA